MFCSVVIDLVLPIYSFEFLQCRFPDNFCVWFLFVCLFMLIYFRTIHTWPKASPYCLYTCGTFFCIYAHSLQNFILNWLLKIDWLKVTEIFFHLYIFVVNKFSMFSIPVSQSLTKIVSGPNSQPNISCIETAPPSKVFASTMVTY